MSVETPSKVKASHLPRAAYVYVRQSTLRQVLNNTESTVRQYDLRQRAVALGWPPELDIVVDVDQGHSGASAAAREGFQRLVADVSMGCAGIVLGLECSRLARNNADWHRLLEICALTDTLICDENGIYDPSGFNDRMLLSLKGTLSEAELHFIRARLRSGQLSKARRGELPMMLPVGLVYDPTGKVVLDPDGGVQQALRHLFTTFAHSGSSRAVVQTFRAEGLLFPGHIRTGHTRASCHGHRCATIGCCVSCTTRAMPGRSPMGGSGSAPDPTAGFESSGSPERNGPLSSPTPTPVTSPGKPSSSTRNC
jgi:DNA invertase Pin-like site-specific DNA recombinase